jgi:hypothetical protein
MDRLASRSMDRYLPEDVRTTLEERFWHTVEERSTVEAFSRDRTILGAPDTHPALFSDHGVVHARDVATGTLELADVIDGRLLLARPVDRREFVHGSRGLDRLHPRRGDDDPTPDGRPRDRPPQGIRGRPAGRRGRGGAARRGRIVPGVRLHRCRVQPADRAAGRLPGHRSPAVDPDRCHRRRAPSRAEQHGGHHRAGLSAQPKLLHA